MEPFSAFALASTALSAGGAVMSGVSAAQGAAANAQAATDAAEYGKLQAQQTGAAMQSQLSDTLANISAVRATTNTSSKSPTLAAITSNVEANADDSRGAKMAGINAQVRADENASRRFQSSEGTYILGGILNGAGKGLSAFSGDKIKNPFAWSATP